MKPDMKQSLTYDSSTGKMYAELGSTTQSSNQESNRYPEKFIPVLKQGIKQVHSVLKPGIKQVPGAILSSS